MHFIKNNVSRRFKLRTYICLPTFRISSLQVNNGCPFAIHTYCFCIDARSITKPFIVYFYIKSIEFSYQILINRCCPRTFLSQHHRYRFIGMSALACLIKHQTYFICRRRPKSKLRCLRCILHFNQTSCTDRI